MKRGLPFGLFFILSFFLFKGNLFLEKTRVGPSEAMTKKLLQKVEHLSFAEISLSTAFEMLAQSSGINLIASSIKPRTITLSLNEITYFDALISLIETAGLQYNIFQDVLILTEKGDQPVPGEKVELVQLKNHSAEKMVILLIRVFPKLSKVSSDESKGVIVLQGLPQQIFEAKEFIQEMDAIKETHPTIPPADETTSTGSLPLKMENLSKSIELKYGKASEVLLAIRPQFPPELQIIADPRTNQLLLSGLPTDLKHCEEVISNLDQPISQVLIEARLIEVSTDKMKELGIRWGGEELVIDGKKTEGLNFVSEKDRTLGFKYHKNDFVNSVLTQNNSGALPEGLTQGNLSSDFTFSTIRGQVLQSLLTILETKAQANTISRPKIMTQNLKEARINVGSRVPVRKETIQDGRVSVSYEFQDTGISLIVTPQVHQDNHVTVNVEAEVSTVTGFTPAPDNQPIIGTRNAHTIIRIRDGDTIAIAGLLDASKSDSKTKNPFLGDLPLLGNLFRSTNKSNKQTELVIFLTPRVVYEPGVVKEMNQVENIFESLKPSVIPEKRRIFQAPPPPSSKSRREMTPFNQPKKKPPKIQGINSISSSKSQELVDDLVKSLSKLNPSQNIAPEINPLAVKVQLPVFQTQIGEISNKGPVEEEINGEIKEDLNQALIDVTHSEENGGQSELKNEMGSQAARLEKLKYKAKNILGKRAKNPKTLLIEKVSPHPPPAMAGLKWVNSPKGNPDELQEPAISDPLQKKWKEFKRLLTVQPQGTVRHGPP